MCRTLLISSLLLSTLGCGGALPASQSPGEKLAGGRPSSQMAAGGEASFVTRGRDAASNSAAPNRFPQLQDGDSQRKIIYRAQLDLVVNDFDKTELAAPRLVAEHGGYLADVHLARNAGDNRYGKWTIRVPVDRFEAFLDAASKLGVPTRRQQSGQDVTEEYIDLEARLVTKQKFEERLIKLVEDRADSVKDLIVVEQQLARVRTEIEQMQGRQRYLQNQTSMTTVTLTAQEQHDYTPPETPGLGSQIAMTWNGSLGSMQNLGANLVLVGVSAAPWLLMVGAVVGPAWMMRRRSTPQREA